jgi:hypothetical protein
VLLRVEPTKRLAKSLLGAAISQREWNNLRGILTRKALEQAVGDLVGRETWRAPISAPIFESPRRPLSMTCPLNAPRFRQGSGLFENSALYFSGKALIGCSP